MWSRELRLCSLLFGVKFKSLAFKSLCFVIVGCAAARAFFAIIAAAIATAAFALGDRRVNPAAKIVCSRSYAQYNDNQLNIHIFTSCFPHAPCGVGRMCQ